MVESNKVESKNVIDQIGQATREQPVVAVFGEVLADVFPDKSVLGGAPFNVARHLQAFLCHPVMITRTGNDELRKMFLTEMARFQMDVSGIQVDPTFPTGQVYVRFKDNTHYFEILPDQAYDHIHAGVAHMITLAAHPEMVYFGTLAQRHLDSRLALDTFLSDAKCPRFLDLNLRAPWYDKHTVRRSLLRSDIVKLNEEELDIVTRYFKSGLNRLEDQAHYLLDKFDFHTLLVTCGAKGAYLFQTKNKPLHMPSPEIGTEMVDTVGAGDAFAAICMLALLKEWPMEMMLERAAEFAAAICKIRGAVPEDLTFYDSYIRKWSA